MYKETGRINVNVAGVVSDISKNEDGSVHISVDDEIVYIKHSSAALLDKIKSGQYVKLECYIDSGKVFVTSVN